MFNQVPEITEDNLIEWDIFVPKNSSLVYDLVQLSELESSKEVISVALAYMGWNPYQVIQDGKTIIGYGSETQIDSNGLTESASYSEFIGRWKETERKLKRLISVNALSQTQYDALVSLYFFTGDFKYVGTGTYRFYIGDYIKQGKWDYIATALIKSNYQRSIRRQEANILMLADYGQPKSREDIREQSLQEIRKRHPELLSPVQRQQAEYVYYSETKRFLPKMTQSRMRQIVKLLSTS